jgi:hypothetical protein
MWQSKQLVILLLIITFAGTKSTATDPTVHDAMLCVYPLSGTYGLLPRLLYFATLVLAIFGRSQEWLVIGALASALTYAGTAAIHAAALCTSRKDVFDLDIHGTWAVLSTGALAYITLINWSTTLRNSRARIVLVCWGILVGLGLIFGRVQLYDSALSAGEPPCHSSRGELLSLPAQLLDPSFNCTYKCFSVQKPMRQQSDILAVPKTKLTNRFSDLGVILVGPVMYAAYTAISLDSREHTPSQFCTRLVFRYLSPDPHPEMTRSIYKASSESWYGGYFLLLSFVRKSKWSIRKFIISSLAVPWFLLGLVLDILCIPLLMTNVVLNELVILGSRLPTTEPPAAIGQWGQVVGAILVVMASIINKGLEIRERRRQALDIPREDVQMEGPRGEYDPGKLEEQTTGVVPKGLGRQETLKDMNSPSTSSR